MDGVFGIHDAWRRELKGSGCVSDFSESCETANVSGYSEVNGPDKHLCLWILLACSRLAGHVVLHVTIFKDICKMIRVLCV